jgi:phosphatidylethanolamine/phosphatidyl-N-methylethanolamine N-methyltransferase
MSKEQADIENHPAEPSTARISFAKAFARNPNVIGAVSPSSRFLARQMIRAAGPIEGGTLTREILSSGVNPERLDVVEFLPDFAEALRRRFRRVRVHQVDASSVDRNLLGEPASVVFSGLPLRAMPDAKVEKILSAVINVASERARIVQFSYGLRCPVTTEIQASLSLMARRFCWVPLNIPPAFVWILQSVPASKENRRAGR